jgi:hypothetical protein
MDVVRLLGSVLGLGFVAGLRLYGTVLVIGVSIRYGFFHPSGELAGLAVLADKRVLIVAGIAFVLEFFADKILWFDSIWDSFHTFIRPIGAAVLAAAAVHDVEPATKVAIVILCGGVALASHSSKAATRLAVNHSPEPFSNIALSIAGDLFVPSGVWLALRHPLVSLAFIVGFVAVFVWLSRKVFRMIVRFWANRSRTASPTAPSARYRPG